MSKTSLGLAVFGLKASPTHEVVCIVVTVS